MNYLQLVKRLRLEGGVSGTDFTVSNASGEWARLVTWIAQAWEDIQREHTGWMWMRKTVTFSTIANQGNYPINASPLSLSDFSHWFRKTFRVYKDNDINNELFLTDIPYEDFRDTYLYGSNRTTTGYPTVITVSPTKSLVVAQVPENSSYKITGDYYSEPTKLINDSDTPEMPEQYHMAIVWKALMMYGGYENAPDAYDRGSEAYEKIMTQLGINQLPPVVINRCF